MKIDIITAFPEMFKGPFSESIVSRAQDEGLVSVNVFDLRQWTEDKHRTIDSPPYGGGPGMVMRVDIIDRAVEDLKSDKSKVILLDAKGEIYKQKKAQELSDEEHLILIAGHYEGVDHRVHEHIADEVISIGKYVLTGGEIPVMVLVDSVVRLVPEVVGNPESINDESYSQSDTVEYPQYTRPDEYKGWEVPEILKSGHHEKINKWRESKRKKV